MGVADGQSAERKVAPDVAAQSLDMKPTEPPDASAVERRFDPLPPDRRQRPVAHRRGHADHQGEQSQRDETTPSALYSRSGCLGGRFGQNACPILM